MQLTVHRKKLNFAFNLAFFVWGRGDARVRHGEASSEVDP